MKVAPPAGGCIISFFFEVGEVIFYIVCCNFINVGLDVILGFKEASEKIRSLRWPVIVSWLRSIEDKYCINN